MTQLTQGEIRVLRHLAGGYSNKEVARILDLSVRTVETHRLNLRRKAGLRRVRDLIVYSREHGIQAV